MDIAFLVGFLHRQRAAIVLELALDRLKKLAGAWIGSDEVEAGLRHSAFTNEAFEFGDGRTGVFAIGDGSKKRPGAVKEKNRSRMVHGVIAVVQLDFSGVNPESPGHFGDFVGGPCNSDYAPRYAGDIKIENFGRVTRRIDRYEIGLQFSAILTQFAQPSIHLKQRGRAEFGTVGKTEEHGGRMSPERLFGNSGAALVNKFERRAERLTAMESAIPGKCYRADNNREHDQQAICEDT